MISGNEKIGGNSSVGIRVGSGVSGFIFNNTINGGKVDATGVLSAAISLINGASPAINNNILLAPQTDLANTICVMEDINSDPSSLRNNNYFGCLILYLDEQSTEITDISDVNNLFDIATSGNVAFDPVVVNFETGDWRLTVLTPDEITLGGLDLSVDFTTDKEGNNRAPWSTGAYNSSTELPKLVNIDFDGVAPSNDFAVYTEDGLTFTPVQNGNLVASGAVRISDFVSIGDNFAFPNFGFAVQDIILTREDTQPFSLLSVDVIEAISINSPGPKKLVLTGTKVNSLIVSQTITTDGIEGFETFPVLGFSNLLSVRLGDGVSSDISSIDDLVISFE